MERHFGQVHERILPLFLNYGEIMEESPWNSETVLVLLEDL